MSTLPPLPPGFAIDPQVPPPPPGFVLESGGRTLAAPEDVRDPMTGIPGGIRRNGPDPTADTFGDKAIRTSAGILGAPIDLVNTIMGVSGLPSSDAPFLGSKFLDDAMHGITGNRESREIAAAAPGVTQQGGAPIGERVYSSFLNTPEAEAAYLTRKYGPETKVGIGWPIASETRPIELSCVMRTVRKAFSIRLASIWATLPAWQAECQIWSVLLWAAPRLFPLMQAAPQLAFPPRLCCPLAAHSSSAKPSGVSFPKIARQNRRSRQTCCRVRAASLQRTRLSAQSWERARAA